MAVVIASASEMIKWILLLPVVAFIGCRDPNRYTVFQGQGQFLAPKEEIPARAFSIADSLERFPRDPTTQEFEKVLNSSGMKKESDWYKDYEHRWYFDENFAPTQNADLRAYLVTVSYFERGSSRVKILDAGIHRLQSSDPWRVTIWKIQYSKL